MNKDCEVVRDLLTLYADDVCSEASKAKVEEHLAGCEECSEYLKMLKNDTTEKTLEKETVHALEEQKKGFNRKSIIAGSIISAILLIPILICFIVNIADGEKPDWFFIVFSSILIVASVSVVPIVAPRRKAMWMLICFWGSIMLLFITIGFYSHSKGFIVAVPAVLAMASLTVVPIAVKKNKFFWMLAALGVSILALFGVICLLVNGKWFVWAVVLMLFCISLIFLPIAINKKPLKEFFGKNKTLFCVLVDLTLFYLLVLVKGNALNDADYWTRIIIRTTPFVLLALGIALIVSFIGRNGLAKAGVCLIYSSLVVLLEDSVTALLLGENITFDMLNIITQGGVLSYVIFMAVPLFTVGALLFGLSFLVKKKGE